MNDISSHIIRTYKNLRERASKPMTMPAQQPVFMSLEEIERIVDEMNASKPQEPIVIETRFVDAPTAVQFKESAAILLVPLAEWECSNCAKVNKMSSKEFWGHERNGANEFVAKCKGCGNKELIHGYIDYRR